MTDDFPVKPKTIPLQPFVVQLKDGKTLDIQGCGIRVEESTIQIFGPEQVVAAFPADAIMGVWPKAEEDADKEALRVGIDKGTTDMTDEELRELGKSSSE